MHRLNIDPSKLFSEDVSINQDILVLIRDYLRNCGLQATATTLKNESGITVKKTRAIQRRLHVAVTEGDWETLRELSKTGPLTKLRKAFLYLVNRQEFLELVNKNEPNAAFSHLLRRLKPLESQAKIAGDDFRDLAYLSTCRSVTDSPSFRNWEGVTTSRKKLFKELVALTCRHDILEEEFLEDGEEADSAAAANSTELDEKELYDSDYELEESEAEDAPTKQSRLLSLLQQAYAYQIENNYSSDAILSATPKISSLLVDYTSPILPDPTKSCSLSGHEQSVKSLEFISDRKMIASGSSDTNVILWDLNNKGIRHVGQGHTGRVWDLSANYEGTHLASVSADSSLRLWDISNVANDENTTLLSKMIVTGHAGDVYSVKFHPHSRNHIFTTGYDHTARLIDLETERVVKVFRGHASSVVHAVFNPIGNLVVTGSKDFTVKVFDIVSGVCVKTLPHLLGEVASVQFNSAGDKLLTATKDSSNRLWDTRTGSIVSRFKGHVNCSKNFIRAQFGSSDQIILGGSEDGAIHVWDADSGNLLNRFVGHSGCVFRSIWSPRWNLLGSCSEDGMVRVWESKSLSPT